MWNKGKKRPSNTLRNYPCSTEAGRAQNKNLRVFGEEFCPAPRPDDQAVTLDLPELEGGLPEAIPPDAAQLFAKIEARAGAFDFFWRFSAPGRISAIQTSANWSLKNCERPLRR
jgi:hypothetical protein